MKIRRGFVSNSSTSSFICQISGELVTDEHGYMDGDIAKCTKKHVFLPKYLVKATIKTIDQKRDVLNIDTVSDFMCDSFYINWDDYREILKSDEKIEDLWQKYEDDIMSFIYEGLGESEGKLLYVTPPFCPICQFKNVPKDKIISWLLIERYGKPDLNLALKDIKTRYSSYEIFLENLKK